MQLLIDNAARLYAIDLGSMHGTRVAHQDAKDVEVPLKSGQAVALSDGDTLIFGKRIPSPDGVTHFPLRVRVSLRYEPKTKAELLPLGRQPNYATNHDLITIDYLLGRGDAPPRRSSYGISPTVLYESDSDIELPRGTPDDIIDVTNSDNEKEDDIIDSDIVVLRSSPTVHAPSSAPHTPIENAYVPDVTPSKIVEEAIIQNSGFDVNTDLENQQDALGRFIFSLSPNEDAPPSSQPEPVIEDDVPSPPSSAAEPHANFVAPQDIEVISADDMSGHESDSQSVQHGEASTPDVEVIAASSDIDEGSVLGDDAVDEDDAMLSEGSVIGDHDACGGSDAEDASEEEEESDEECDHASEDEDNDCDCRLCHANRAPSESVEREFASSSVFSEAEDDNASCEEVCASVCECGDCESEHDSEQSDSGVEDEDEVDHSDMDVNSDGASALNEETSSVVADEDDDQSAVDSGNSDVSDHEEEQEAPQLWRYDNVLSFSNPTLSGPAAVNATENAERHAPEHTDQAQHNTTSRPVNSSLQTNSIPMASQSDTGAAHAALLEHERTINQAIIQKASQILRDQLTAMHTQSQTQSQSQSQAADFSTPQWSLPPSPPLSDEGKIPSDEVDSLNDKIKEAEEVKKTHVPLTPPTPTTSMDDVPVRETSPMEDIIPSEGSVSPRKRLFSETAMASDIECMDIASGPAAPAVPAAVEPPRRRRRLEKLGLVLGSAAVGAVIGGVGTIAALLQFAD